MNLLDNIELHSIGIGIVGTGIQFYVGQTLQIEGEKTKITDIVRDVSEYEYYKEVVYMIFAEVKGEKTLIKFYVNQPVYGCVKI